MLSVFKHPGNTLAHLTMAQISRVGVRLKIKDEERDRSVTFTIKLIRILV